MSSGNICYSIETSAIISRVITVYCLKQYIQNDLEVQIEIMKNVVDGENYTNIASVILNVIKDHGLKKFGKKFTEINIANKDCQPFYMTDSTNVLLCTITNYCCVREYLKENQEVISKITDTIVDGGSYINIVEVIFSIIKEHGLEKYGEDDDDQMMRTLKAHGVDITSLKNDKEVVLCAIKYTQTSF